MVAPVVPVAIATAVKLGWKPAMKLAKQLAKKYWKASGESAKKKIVQEARDKKVLDKFSSAKLRYGPKVKDTKKPLSKKSYEERSKYWEKGYARKAKKEGIDVAGKTKQEMIDTVQAHSRATRPYSPRFQEGRIPNINEKFKKLQGLKKYAPSSKAGRAHGGSVKKYATGGGVRKARTYG